MEKMRTHPSKKKAILLAAGCLVLAAAVAAVWLFNRPQPGKLYHFQPGEVTQVYLQHYADMRDVTDPAQVEEIVDLLNGFTYLLRFTGGRNRLDHLPGRPGRGRE